MFITFMCLFTLSLFSYNSTNSIKPSDKIEYISRNKYIRLPFQERQLLRPISCLSCDKIITPQKYYKSNDIINHICVDCNDTL